MYYIVFQAPYQYHTNKINQNNKQIVVNKWINNGYLNLLKLW